ncbi:MAG: TonB family protein [Gemmatimonadales bacterium]|nr:TonB family protein [Gemmatimonadales bacterium]MDZ4389513.1 TonB family protein [Gemmatimonadales bacterium]
MRAIAIPAILMVLPVSGAAQQRCSPVPSVMPDRPAEIKWSPEADDTVRYPAAMRASGVTGVVRLRFTVCADGEIDPASLEVVRANHDEFVPAAVWALSRTRAVPASWRGVVVHQVVELVMRMAPPGVQTKRRGEVRDTLRRAGAW